MTTIPSTARSEGSVLHEWERKEVINGEQPEALEAEWRQVHIAYRAPFGETVPKNGLDSFNH